MVVNLPRDRTARAVLLWAWYRARNHRNVPSKLLVTLACHQHGRDRLSPRPRRVLQLGREPASWLCLGAGPLPSIVAPTRDDAGPACPGDVLVRARDRRVYEGQVPIERAVGIRLCLPPLRCPVEHTCLATALVPA